MLECRRRGAVPSGRESGQAWLFSSATLSPPTLYFCPPSSVASLLAAYAGLPISTGRLDVALVPPSPDRTARALLQRACVFRPLGDAPPAGALSPVKALCLFGFGSAAHSSQSTLSSIYFRLFSTTKRIFSHFSSFSPNISFGAGSRARVFSFLFLRRAALRTIQSSCGSAETLAGHLAVRASERTGGVAETDSRSAHPRLERTAPGRAASPGQSKRIVACRLRSFVRRRVTLLTLTARARLASTDNAKPLAGFPCPEGTLPSAPTPFSAAPLSGRPDSGWQGRQSVARNAKRKSQTHT